MKPLRLYISDFFCHENSFIDFTLFQSALIIGKVKNNDLYSNAVGKTTIFNAIEYCLFNQADVNLESIIRDGCSFCQVCFDFSVDDKEFRIIRRRTVKNVTDLILLEKNINSKLHDISQNNVNPSVDGWTDLTGRRSADTEKEIEKIIKTNFKSFRNTVHFAQNDFTGLSTVSPEKRKLLLKDALNLAVYSKLEKIAKEKSKLLIKEIDKLKLTIESLSNTEIELLSLKENKKSIEDNLSYKKKSLSDLEKKSEAESSALLEFEKNFSDLEKKHFSLTEKCVSLKSDNDKNCAKNATTNNKIVSLKNEISSISLNKDKCVEKIGSLSKIDLSKKSDLQLKIDELKNAINKNSATIQHTMSIIEELNTPLPKDNMCKHCRQPMSKEHRDNCLKQISEQISSFENKILLLKKENIDYNLELKKNQTEHSAIVNSQESLKEIELKLSELDNNFSFKESSVIELNSQLSASLLEIESNNNLISSISKEIESIDLSILNKSKVIKDNLLKINSEVLSLNKEISHNTGSLSIIDNDIKNKEKSISKLFDLKTDLSALERSYNIYPSVIDAFSSTGIPNLIIHNILDEIQLKANELLLMIKPGLQLSFLVEKTKTDGSDGDTLDIAYSIHNKKREYAQLSGAQKLCVAFSLKLALSNLLQNVMGSNIKFLLLDEIDQSLDAAGIDAFAEIVRFFQKEYSILIITHNERLKDKINNYILVEQDANMVSRAKVVN